MLSGGANPSRQYARQDHGGARLPPSTIWNVSI